MTSTSTATLRSPMMTINGRGVGSTATITVLNPATAEVFAEVPDCSQALLQQALDAATAAQREWRERTWQERQDVVRQLADVVEAAVEELAELVTLEVGKPLGNARSEVKSGLAWARHFAGIEEFDEVIRDDDAATVRVERVPHGVVAAITAWNYPLMLALLKITPALVAGNAVVVKPSPYTPVATLRLGEIIADHLPPGLVQILSGGDDLGRWMTQHPQVDKIAFTGSVRTGKAIMASAANTMKRLTLELGGNDAGIVLPGQDPQRFAEPLFWAGFSNIGEVCTGLKRLYVPEDEVGAWCEALGDVAEGVTIGDGMQPETQLGPLQNEPQLQRVVDLLTSALDDGGRIAYQGSAPDGPGFFHPITIVRDVAEGTRLVDEEQFGPVLPVIGYRSVDDAVDRANDSRLGLGASVWSADVQSATDVVRRLEAGSVWVNRHPALSPDAPFGGLKESGVGVESSHHGLAEYSNLRVVNVKHEHEDAGK